MEPALQTIAPLAQHNFSVIGLFLQADPIVKLVMLSLVGASIWSWAIIFAKVLRLGRIKMLQQF